MDKNFEYVCKNKTCTGCMACYEICPKNAITIEDSLNFLNARIDLNKCVKCGLCKKVCQQKQELSLTKPYTWYQGWASDAILRNLGSSGGVATALMYSFIKNGGYVASCTFSNGEFRFNLTNRIDDLYHFCGSKYVKSCTQDIYKKIKDKLKQGEKVLYIGLPCQVCGLTKYLSQQNIENLYTVDLICHGTPSSLLLERFLHQYKVSLKEINNISFRNKNKFQLEGGFHRITINGIYDRYMMMFLKQKSYTECCYNCRFARIERISDITLGDSWGSELSKSEKEKGISLILCQTLKGKGLIMNSNISIHSVNINNAIKNNKQLSRHALPSLGRTIFFVLLKNNFNFNFSAFWAMPKLFFKQNIKFILLKVGLLKIKSGG